MSNYTQCTSPILTSPIKFLGATVLNFSSSLGVGGNSESTLTVDLIEDCEAVPPDSFTPATGSTIVGDAVYFSGGGFSFGGVLTNWTQSQSSSGKTYNATITDPRQLLQNVSIVVDSFLGVPIAATNYFNAYAYYESNVANGDCAVFGTSGGTERGMPYWKVRQALINSTDSFNIFSPTGDSYRVYWSDFPQPPDYYRVTGPQTALQMLTDVCDSMGFNFYVYLEKSGGIDYIRVGTIDLKSQPGSFSSIYGAFNGSGTEISYGQELRNEVTKAMLVGEQVHYLTYVDEFEFYFGEDPDGDIMVPIAPSVIDNESNNFWFSKNIAGLNATLYNPIVDGGGTATGNGPYYISEIDIRAAMSSFDLWQFNMAAAVWTTPEAAANKETGPTKTWPPINSLNRAIQNLYPDIASALNTRQDNQNNAIGLNMGAEIAIFNPDGSRLIMSAEKFSEDLTKIHAFVQELGTTYYGKQWLARLNEKICYYPGQEYQEKVFSSVPTNNGGWADDGAIILNLAQPELDTFRTDDGRVSTFAAFTADGVSPDAGDGADDENAPNPDFDNNQE